jgi:hypothetical protein
MTENPLGTAGEHGCHPPAPNAQTGVSDCQNATVQAVPPAARDTMGDRSPTDAECSKLPHGHDPMLSLRQLGDDQIEGLAT